MQHWDNALRAALSTGAVSGTIERIDTGRIAVHPLEVAIAAAAARRAGSLAPASRELVNAARLVLELRQGMLAAARGGNWAPLRGALAAAGAGGGRLLARVPAACACELALCRAADCVQRLADALADRLGVTGRPGALLIGSVQLNALRAAIADAETCGLRADETDGGRLLHSARFVVQVRRRRGPCVPFVCVCALLRADWRARVRSCASCS